MLQRFRNLSIRNKLIVEISLLIGLVTIFLMVYFPIRQKNITTKGLENKAVSLAEMIAYTVAAGLEFEDQISVEQALKGVESDVNFRYAKVIQDPYAVENFAEFVIDGFEMPKEIETEQITYRGKMLHIVQTIRSLAGDEIGLLQIGFSLDQIITESRRMTVTTFVVSLIIFIVGIASAFQIANTITLPLSEVVLRLREIAEGGGNLAVQLDDNRKDELGELAKSFNTFIAKLREIIYQVVEATELVASASVELSTAATEITVGASNVASDSDIVASALEEISSQTSTFANDFANVSNQTNHISDSVSDLFQTAEQIAAHTSKVALTAQSAAEISLQGNAVVEKTIQEINQIAKSVKETGSFVETLQKSSQEIGEIIDLIRQIAEQTNLLSINAAIEAAHAGSQGMAFAVVAQEVHKLSDSTTMSARRVNEMISGIQAETKRVFESMEESLREVQTGRDLVLDTGQTLTKIIREVNNVTEMINDVANAATQQSGATQQITKNIEQIAILAESSKSGVEQIVTATQDSTESARRIAIISQQSANGAEQSDHAAADLAKLSTHLKTIVNQFKLGK